VYLARISSTGALTWVRQLGNVTAPGLATSFDEVRGAAVDSTGNIFITGQTQGALGGPNGGLRDIFLVKYDVDGNYQWTEQLGTGVVGVNSPAGADVAKGIAVDRFGDIYVAGDTDGSLGETNAGGQDAFVAKFSAAGSLLWIKQLATGTGIFDSSNDEYAYAITIDDQDRPVLAGYTYGDLAELNGGGADTFVARLSTTGTLEAVYQLGAVHLPGLRSAGDDTPAGILADASGIVVTGSTTSDLAEPQGGGSFFGDIFLVKLSSSGVLLWESQLGLTTAAAAASDEDIAYGLARDPAGNFFVSGGTFGALGQASGGSSDVILAKFDSSGVHQWTEQLGAVYSAATTAGNDTGTAVYLDPSTGDAFVAGITTGPLGETAAGNFDAFVAKFRQ
jgi:hypothetical protein